jgi:hypothetical protein
MEPVMVLRTLTADDPSHDPTAAGGIPASRLLPVGETRDRMKAGARLLPPYAPGVDPKVEMPATWADRDTQASTAVEAMTRPSPAAANLSNSRGWCVAHVARALACTLFFGPSAICLGREARPHAPVLARLLTIGGWMSTVGIFLIFTALLWMSVW